MKLGDFITLVNKNIVAFSSNLAGIVPSRVYMQFITGPLRFNQKFLLADSIA